VISQIRKLLVQSQLLTGFAVSGIILISLLSFLLLFVGGGEKALSLQGSEQQIIPENVDIAGWSSFDRDSVHIGGTIRYQVRIVYRSDRVTPDIEAYEAGVNVLPLEKRQIIEKQRSLEGNLKEYTLEYILQAVGVDLDTSYPLPPSVIYYRTEGQTDLQPLQIESPRIHIASYYPDNISNIELKQLKGEFRDPSILKRTITGVAGVIFLSLCIMSLWIYGKKKSFSELTERERLWVKFEHGIDVPSDKKTKLAVYERIFTQLLTLQTTISPKMFWSGVNPKNSQWKDFSVKARNLLRQLYRPTQPNDQDMNTITQLMHDSFALVVADEKINAVIEPTFWKRLSKQPRLLFKCGAFIVVGTLMLALATLPGIWVPQYMFQYNLLVNSIQEEGVSEKKILEFSEIGNVAIDSSVKAAAFYNSGTLTAQDITSLTEDQAALLENIFREFEMDEMAEIFSADSEGLIKTLVSGIEAYRRAEMHFRDSVRADSKDEDASRNLEIVIKRRKAAAEMLSNIVKTGHIEELEMDNLLDLINTQMALEFKFEEGEEAPGYYLGEFF